MKWPEVKLGTLTAITTGKLDANAADENGKYPFFTCAVAPSRINKYAFDCEAVLIAGNGDLNVKYYDGKFNAYQRTYVVQVVDKEQLDVRFLFHFLNLYVVKLRQMAIGGVIKYIKLPYLTDAEISLPPLAEQKRIAKQLDAADRILRLREASIAKLDQLAQSIFVEMFGDVVTNKKWSMRPLKELTSKIGSGATPRGGDSSYKPFGISLIRSLNVHDGEFRPKNLAFIDHEQAGKLSNVIVCKDDVLLNITGASVARVCRVPSTILPARVNQHVMIIRPNQLLNPIFLERLLLSNEIKNKLFQMAGTGATREAITKSSVEDFMIVCPPIEIQEKFSERIKRFEFIKAQMLGSQKKKEIMVRSLQHQSFSVN